MEELRRERNSYQDQKGALCASLFLHSLLLLALSSNSSFIPCLGAETRIDLLWLTSSPQSPPRQAPKAAAAPAQHAASPAPRRPSPAPARAAAASPTLVAEADHTAEDAPPPPQPAAEGVKGAQAPMRLPAGRPEEPPATVPSTIRPAVSVRQEDPAAAAPSPEPANAMPTLPPEPATVHLKSQRSAVASPAVPAAVTAAAPARAAAPPGATVPAAASAPEDSRPNTMQKEKTTTHPPRGAETAAGAAVRPPAQALQKQKPKPLAGPADPQRGVVIASLRGDLKMTIAGDRLKLTVLFRPYPTSRRAVEPTRAEARQVRNVTPVCADAPDRSREAVVEKAGEGVYLFLVEPERGGRAQAAFTLKIYEAGAGERVVALGRREISARTVLARVLMPEGILWDDQGAFTGSIEDAESTTKFNARTGLAWKEYDE